MLEQLGDLFHHFMDFLRNPEVQQTYIQKGGYLLLAAIIFSETGLLVGFFLPGDSLLFSAGVVASKWPDIINIWTLNLLLCAMAIIGDAVGFAFGRWTGHKLYDRKQSFFFRKDHLLAAKEFYDRHGGKTIVLARFMPFARTFAPIVAGVAGMPYRRFLAYNVFGGVGWVMSMSLLGYFLGKQLDPKRTEQMVILIIVASVMPMVIAWAHKKWKARKAVSVAPATVRASDSDDAQPPSAA